jgi:hypothetical protein
VYPTLDPLPGAITNPEDPLIGRRLPIYCTISDGRHTFSGNYSNIQTFFPTPASILAVYGQEAQGASTSTAVISMQPAPFFRSAGVGGEWARYLALYCGHGVEPCCGEIIDGKTFVNVYFSCDATTGAWVMQWNTAMVCYRWALGLCGVSQEYDYKVFSQYNDSGSITIPAASNGLPEPGTHSLASASPTGVPCEPGEYIRNASITISHS